MNFGVPIDDVYLRNLEQYKYKPDLTAKDRSTVAFWKKDVYATEAVNRLEQLKHDYGNSVNTLCRFYNASGDQIKINFDHSWRGHFYMDSPASTVENGQWTTFLHADNTSSCGAVIYRTASNSDIFIGWRNPSNTCCAESFERDHWWAAGSESYMLDLLVHRTTHRSSVEWYGYKATVNIGQSTTSSCVAVIEKV